MTESVYGSGSPQNRALFTRGINGQGHTEKVTAQVQSPNFSLPSSLHCFKAGQGGDTPWLGKEKEGSTLSSARGVFSLDPHSLGIKANSYELVGTLLNGRRKIFKAMGKPFCQA